MMATKFLGRSDRRCLQDEIFSGLHPPRLGPPASRRNANAASRAALAAGLTELIVCDPHHVGGNFIRKKLLSDPRITYLYRSAGLGDMSKATKPHVWKPSNCSRTLLPQPSRAEPLSRAPASARRETARGVANAIASLRAGKAAQRPGVARLDDHTLEARVGKQADVVKWLLGTGLDMTP
jgi:hypothetical protein